MQTERGKSWLEWATKAGISDGAVRGFAMAPPGGKEQTMQLSKIVRLAWAAQVSVSRLIGEATPEPSAAPSSSMIEQLRREIESTAVQQDLRGQMLALHQRIAELEHGLQVAQRERDALRLQIAELPRHE